MASLISQFSFVGSGYSCLELYVRRQFAARIPGKRQIQEVRLETETELRFARSERSLRLT